MSIVPAESPDRPFQIDQNSPSEYTLMSSCPPLISRTMSAYCSKKWFSAAPQEGCILSSYTFCAGGGDGVGDGDGDGVGLGLGDGVGAGAGPAQATTSGITNIRLEQTLPSKINNFLVLNSTTSSKDLSLLLPKYIA